MQSGDSTEVIKLQDLKFKAMFEVRGLSTELKDTYKAVEAQKNESPRQPVNQVPERAQEWISDHPEFKTDELFYNSSIVVNNQLLREGFDANSEDFYEELDTRLGKRFPEVFGISQEKGVHLGNTTDSLITPSSVKAGVPVRQSTTTARTVDQVVSGSSRPSANVIQTRNSQQVTLTAADIQQANIWGLDLKQMARRIAHKEANTRTDGYVPINIPRN
jgi:hypothetical protein